MWLLHFLPDAFLVTVVHLIFVVGLVGSVIGFFASKLPIITTYGQAIKLISGILLITGIYFEGGLSTEKIWRDKVTKLELQIKASEEQSKLVNSQIKTVYVDKIKTVKEVEYIVQEKIKEVEKTVNKDCIVNDDMINILNLAVSNKKPE